MTEGMFEMHLLLPFWLKTQNKPTYPTFKTSKLLGLPSRKKSGKSNWKTYTEMMLLQFHKGLTES